MEGSVCGFILQPTYRLERGKAVVHLWGRLETGESFLVRDDRLTPYFYIRAADTDLARQSGVKKLFSTKQVNFAGEPVARVEVSAPPETPQIRDRLHQHGVLTYEADVRFAMRYLIDKRIRGSLAIRGRSSTHRGVARVFNNPEIEPSDWQPELSVLSIDIETDPEARCLLAVALHGCGVSEVLLVVPPERDCPPTATAVRSEAELMQTLCRRVRDIDPDIITGWNVIDFDFAVLLRRAANLGLTLELGRGQGPARLRLGRGRREASQALVPGRLILDGLQLLRGAFVRMEQHSLDYVAKQVLGEGKTIVGSDRAQEIFRTYEQDCERFVNYNLTDSRLALEILERLKLVELAIERSRLTGMPLDRIASSVASFDFLYLMELGKRGVVAPSVGSGQVRVEATGGGHVLEPQPGLYRNVLVLDYRSLYPSLIRTFQIDPLGYVADPQPDDELIIAPNGAAFRRQAGILTLLLDDLFPLREGAKQAGDRVKSYAIKILMNSFFGVLGTPVCRFYNPAVANAITSSGREILLWSRRQLELWGYQVLYGDTDSLFVASGLVDPSSARALGDELVARLNRSLEEYVRSTWSLESRLEVEFDTLYLRLFLPSVRHGTAGARKRYAGMIDRGGRPEVVFTGLEAVRRDWTDLARQAQAELYRRLFLEEPVEEYLRELAEDLRLGRLDDLLVYTKALRKDLDAYVSTSPPHVVAARKIGDSPGSLVRYVMTKAGPEPAGARENPIDYQHYLDKQLRPVAQPVLSQLGLKFAKIVGEDHQMDLF